MTRGVSSSALPRYVVTVAGHLLGKTGQQQWEIPDSEEICFAKTAQVARVEAVIMVHVRHEVVTYKPYKRETYRHTTAELRLEDD